MIEVYEGGGACTMFESNMGGHVCAPVKPINHTAFTITMFEWQAISTGLLLPQRGHGLKAPSDKNE
eukprot:m.91998 g.91998  ORF g.91998 m.91998 type:complete len:66 (-) comp12971_c0_seq2:466-663(-)